MTLQQIATVLAGLLLALAANAQQKLLPAQSDISFIVRQMGVPLDGKFSKFDAQLALDPKNPEVGKVAFTIDLASVSVGDAETAKELRKPEWFNLSKFPSATYNSTAIKAAGPGKFDVTGLLSIKGNTKPVTIPVTLSPGPAGVSVAQGSFLIKRVDFKIGEGDWSDVSIVASDVTVKFKLAVSGM